MVAAPIVFIGLVLIIDADLLALYPIMKLLVFVIIVGFILSIPTMLLVGFISNMFKRRIENIRGLKFAAISLSVIGVIVTFLLLGPGILDEGKKYNWGLILTFLYCLFIIVFGSIFKIKMKYEDDEGI